MAPRSVGPAPGDRLDPLDPTRPDELFDASWYLATYPDVAARTRNAWGHFALHGELEGRSPGPAFDPEFYRRTHLELEGSLPFTHYVARGRSFGHAPRALDLTAAQTRFAIGAALAGRLNPILLIGNDARAAGAPLMVLEIAKRLRTRGWSPVFLLNQGGPLFPRYAALGPTMIASEGWDLPALGAALPVDLPILANTSWGGLVVTQLGVAPRSVVLVQEMADYLVEHELLDAVGQAHTLIASMPRVESDLHRLLNDRHAAIPGRLGTIVPGLVAPSSTPRGVRSVRRRLAAEFGHVGPIVIGAGYADARKGFDRFVDAATAIARRSPDAVAVWLGDRSSWAQEIADRAIADGLRLLLPGFRADADDWYAASDVYLLTSRQDPGPTTVMNAAAVGVPFVGLRADIGIADLAEVIAETGEFVDTIEALAERALAVAGAQTGASRSRRSAYVRANSSLDRYVDDLERVLDEATEPAAGRRAGRIRVRIRLGMLRLAERSSTRIVAASGRGIVTRLRRAARTVAPRASSMAAVLRRPRLVSVAVVEPPVPPRPVGIPSSGAIGEAAAVHSLDPGDRAWITTPALLAALREPADVHLLRTPGTPPWQLIRDLEPASGRIARITQYDTTDAPSWARRGALPPRARRHPVTAPVAPEVTVLAPRASVRLERSIGVFVHAYYVDLMPQLAERIDLISHPIQLHVSTDDEAKAEELRSMLPTATVHVMPNRGRDIAPKIVGFAPAHAAHDIVLHLHTKRSPHRDDLRGWLGHILDSLLPSTDGVDAILTAFTERERLGMVIPSRYAGLAPTGRWGPNRAIAEVLTWQRGWPPLPDDDALEFAAGSMFWARSGALRPLHDLGIPIEAFSESHAADGTLAHAVERLIGVSCDVAGFEQIVVAPQPDATSNRKRSPGENR